MKNRVILKDVFGILVPEAVQRTSGIFTLTETQEEKSTDILKVCFHSRAVVSRISP